MSKYVYGTRRCTACTWHYLLDIGRRATFVGPLLVRLEPWLSAIPSTLMPVIAASMMLAAILIRPTIILIQFTISPSTYTSLSWAQNRHPIVFASTLATTRHERSTAPSKIRPITIPRLTRSFTRIFLSWGRNRLLIRSPLTCQGESTLRRLITYPTLLPLSTPLLVSLTKSCLSCSIADIRRIAVRTWRLSWNRYTKH